MLLGLEIFGELLSVCNFTGNARTGVYNPDYMPSLHIGYTTSDMLTGEGMMMIDVLRPLLSTW